MALGLAVAGCNLITGAGELEANQPTTEASGSGGFDNVGGTSTGGSDGGTASTGSAGAGVDAGGNGTGGVTGAGGLDAAGGNAVAICGDDTCSESAGETCITCTSDCGDCPPLCGNGVIDQGETCEPPDCPSTCDDGNVCTSDSTSGSETSCDLACGHVVVTSCADADGCCPSGCNSASDDDCSVSCGNGLVEAGETCEGLSCPTVCNDNAVCTTDTMTGSAANCNAVCAHNAIVTCVNNDGCCPAGCTNGNDNDCAAPTNDFLAYNLQVINQYRAQKGVAPLALDAQLNLFAEASADDETISHVAHKYFNAAKTAGTLFKSGFYGSAAENQGDAFGWSALSTDPTENTLLQIDATLQSMFDEGPGGGHYDTMMAAKYTRLGVGLVTMGGELYLANEFSEALPPGAGSNDTTAPPVPTNFLATAMSSGRIKLTWSGIVDSSGGSGLAGYRVYANAASGVDTNSIITRYMATGLSASTQYCFTISSVDFAGNESAKTASKCATTLAQETATEVALGGYHSCALLSTGVLRCWGANNGRQLGSSGADQRNPIAVPLEAASAVALGYEFSCARRTTGTIACWGANGSGQYGDGTTTLAATPQTSLVPSPAVLPQNLGHWHACAHTAGGVARCMGYNKSGELGIGSADLNDHPTPSQVLSVSTVEQMALGYFHSCARLTDGTARCWGFNGWGELGNGTMTASSTPVAVSSLTNVTHVAAGHQFSCAISNQTVSCWGKSSNGELGAGNTNWKSSPQAVPGLTGVSRLALGGKHACALKNDGTLWCWGRNTYGQVGNGTTDNQLSPVQVLSGVTRVGLGEAHSCAVMSGGSIKCWGANLRGQLGDGTTLSKTSPTTLVW